MTEGRFGNKWVLSLQVPGRSHSGQISLDELELILTVGLGQFFGCLG